MFHNTITRKEEGARPRAKENAQAKSTFEGTKSRHRKAHANADKAGAKKVQPYLDAKGNASCPLCQEAFPYSQLDKHIEDVHGPGYSHYYKPGSRQRDVRATFFSAGSPSLGKRR
jgi:hypothetical protein